MAKDVNIHVKAKGTREAKQRLDSVGKSTEQMGSKTSRATSWMKTAFSILKGPLGFAGLATTAVVAIRKIIAALDDMKKAVGEAVRELAAQQKAAADFFEAFAAYTPAERKAALGQARAFQAKTGLGFGASKELLEAYKRTYGEIQPVATEQLAGYWQLHGQEATADLIRWMGTSGVKRPERQGQILRMISTVAGQARIRDPELIRAMTRYAEEFRSMGWTPEQTVMNVGKIVAGTTGRESLRAIAGLVEGLRTFTGEKALEVGAPADIATTKQGRLQWVRQQISGMSLEQRNKFMQEAFGQTYATWVTKFLTGETPAKEKAALEYARTPAAAAEEIQRVIGYRETAEGALERTRGAAGRLKLLVDAEEQRKARIREFGATYLDLLRRRDRVKYEKIKAFGLGEEAEKELAAQALWQTIQPWEGSLATRGSPYYQQKKPSWRGVPLEERLAGLEGATVTIINNHYDNSMQYNPVGGDKTERGIGPRTGTFLP